MPNIAIKKHDGVVVNEVAKVLEVWRRHFANLGTPKSKPNYNDEHFRTVTSFVERYSEGRDMDDDFLRAPFSIDEAQLATKTLNRGKAAGHDMITAEHIVHADPRISEILSIL